MSAGCAHAQQLIWELLNAAELGYAVSGDKDEAFLKGRLDHFRALIQTCIDNSIQRFEKSERVLTEVFILDPGVNSKVRNIPTQKKN